MAKTNGAYPKDLAVSVEALVAAGFTSRRTGPHILFDHPIGGRVIIPTSKAGSGFIHRLKAEIRTKLRRVEAANP